MVNPVHLRTLLEVIAHGSFAAAAVPLGYTASAVSQQMTALERDTGVALFRRSARAIEPTEAATTMARHARKVLTDIDALLAASTTAAGRPGADPTEELRLGIFPSLATFALPRLVGSAGWNDLGINLRISVGEPHQTIASLQSGNELDLALVFQVGQSGLGWPGTMDRQWLGDDDFRVVVPASWKIAEGAQISAAQLANMPWIMHHAGTSDATVISRLFASCDLHPRVVAYCDDFNASLHLAGAGLGAALVPALAMQQRPPGVVVLDVPEIRLARSIFALQLGNSRSPKVDVFMDKLAAELRKISIVP
ncbi:LysR family transcriptional regulator [Arthrobacter rhombi]|uniref:LysR family transcriptional regulator n=1 Tax=Arthrobacter rhombi TaxID=71253 RepID=UPI003FD183B8